MKKPDKIVTVAFTFPEVSGPDGYRERLVRGKGSNWPLALYRAAKELKKQFNRRHINIVKATIMISDAVVEE